MPVAFPQLPPGFRFGTSTASYQIEGAVDADGRRPSIWDTFSHTPGLVHNDDNGDVACDHYHRMEEDVDLIGGLGTHGYRFSVAWPRVQPDGRGAVNQAGLDFYDRLVDSLLAAGQQPLVTLYHWDLPQALQDDGGWLNRATIDHYETYAGIVAERLGDRVRDWIPVNEPNVASMLGYCRGDYAPGLRLGFDGLPAAHHLLVAHGRGAAAIRSAAGGEVQVGCANNHAPMWPASDDAADVGATKLFDSLWNGMFVEPMLLGRYPADLEGLMDPVIVPGDLMTIRQPLDFYGVNYYNPQRVRAADEDAPIPFEFVDLVGYPKTDLDRPVVPDALREYLITLRARFRAALPPIVVTESGCAFNMGPDADGVVDDQPRIDYLNSHIGAVAQAINRGVDVRGYYAWSLLDNFEWAEGFAPRFGLVHVDFETLQRTPKRSYAWYRDLIAAQPGHAG